jgi:hypothetical protein
MIAELHVMIIKTSECMRVSPIILRDKLHYEQGMKNDFLCFSLIIDRVEQNANILLF